MFVLWWGFIFFWPLATPGWWKLLMIPWAIMVVIPRCVTWANQARGRKPPDVEALRRQAAMARARRELARKTTPG